MRLLRLFLAALHQPWRRCRGHVSVVPDHRWVPRCPGAIRSSRGRRVAAGCREGRAPPCRRYLSPADPLPRRRCDTGRAPTDQTAEKGGSWGTIENGVVRDPGRPHRDTAGCSGVGVDQPRVVAGHAARLGVAACRRPGRRLPHDQSGTNPAVAGTSYPPLTRMAHARCHSLVARAARRAGHRRGPPLRCVRERGLTRRGRHRRRITISVIPVGRARRTRRRRRHRMRVSRNPRHITRRHRHRDTTRHRMLNLTHPIPSRIKGPRLPKRLSPTHLRRPRRSRIRRTPISSRPRLRQLIHRVIVPHSG